ncbi:MAG: hypothetical protein N2508_02780 [Anaerolineae bacterium]|nr:hypothetical protein [Anaerolineae bacterium]
MLDDKTRVTLFWFTVGMIAVVIVVGVFNLLIRLLAGPEEERARLSLNPPEVSLCAGESYRFSVTGPGEMIRWRATGGKIDESGVFTAGDKPGDYVVTAISSKPRQVADARVTIMLCTPTPRPSPTPSPTPTPLSTPTFTPAPTPTPLTLDPQGDAVGYESGQPVNGAPPGGDIRTANLRADLRVDLVPDGGVPAELAGWVQPGDALLWLSLYEPIPDPPPYSDWLFALDLDGNIATGRPAGSARINPDLGDDAVIGLLYNPAEARYTPYLMVWNPAQGAWSDGPAVVRFYISESRTLIGLALPLESLTQAVAQTTGSVFVAEAARGRAAALSVFGGQTVIDFFPERPQ